MFIIHTLPIIACVQYNKTMQTLKRYVMYHRTNREYSTIIVIAIGLQQDFESFTKELRYRAGTGTACMKSMTKGTPLENEIF
jgi:hypothetical protein